MNNSFLHFLLPLACCTFLWTSCNIPSHDIAAAEAHMDSCIGPENNRLLEKLTVCFDNFLIDNNFCHGRKDLLDGYKNWLQYLLEQKGMDTTWMFRYNDLEKLISEFEELHFAEWLYDGRFADCLLEVEYPEHYLMAGYAGIMPQHTVSPEKFASEFIRQVNKRQFRDPLLKKAVALDYFLGPVLFVIRPDHLYYAQTTDKEGKVSISRHYH